MQVFDRLISLTVAWYVCCVPIHADFLFVHFMLFKHSSEDYNNTRNTVRTV